MDRLKSILAGILQVSVFWIVGWCIPFAVGMLFFWLVGPFFGLIAFFVAMFFCLRLIL